MIIGQVNDMKKVKSFFSKKEGTFAILYVILIFVGILVIVGFTDVLVRNYTIDEVQSNMDVSGVSALQAGVDKTKLRVGKFEVDDHAVISKYKQMMQNQLKNADKIKSFTFVRTKVELYNSDFGLGNTNRKRPQALIDSTMVIVVDSSQMFDLIPGAYQSYYNSFDDSTLDVNYLGKNDDGKVELSIRSVSRIVYR
jgi:hypothetical protein